ncbi:hypothetical protein EC957_006612 [Mortierella hygrophila]|uniref:Mini-chromosome maintenance complex-binding protein n=1 Tax=Mortierella hygrophila TaxID=979708 RepID=A0A9P6FDN0_9FUNG|nr:hypothetical protein EC957_006612 [Mortierella hygrophila]
MNVIEHPLETIQELFRKNWKEGASTDKDDFGVTKHFQELFDTREKLSKIPVLDAQSINTLPLNSLVRFRCMVQDTELSQEVALFASTISNKPDGEEAFVCHRYSDGPHEDQMLASHQNQELMDLRSSYYCVSVPGQSQWVKDADKPAGLDAALQDLKLEETKASEVIAERFPFPAVSHFAAVVKTTSSDVSIGVADMVEVIGVLGASDKVSSGDSFDFQEESAAGPRIPTVHAILMNKVDDHGHPELTMNGRPTEGDLEKLVKDAKTIREELIQYIAQAVRGDKFAAELVLLHLLARVYSRPSGAVLGKFSLNLKDSTANSPVAKSLEKVVKSVLPKVHAIPMTLTNLNKNYFYPRGEEHLCSGMLQVTRGTLLLLDETAMEEGTLVDQGIKNLKAVTDVSLYQTLNYVFPYNHLEFQTDISLLIISFGSSLVPVDCGIALTPEPSTPEQQSEPTEEKLQSFRRYISALRLAEYKFSEDMAKEIETEFMEQRKAASAAGSALITPNDLALNISLARLVALSKGELTLNRECWDHAVSLSKQIKERSSTITQ